jgi:hypothetical protein
VPETGQLTADPPVAPGRVVAGHLEHESADRQAGARPSRCPPRIGPVAPDQLGVPAQERTGGDDQGQLASARAGDPPARAARNARSAQVSRVISPGGAGRRSGGATRISMFLTLSERGSRAIQPHSRMRIR